MKTPIWANPEKVGVLVLDGDVPLYLDSGEEYEAAVAAGPRPYAGPLPESPPDPAALVAALEAERAGMVASRFQTRAALYVAGLLPMVEAAVAKADPLTKMAWAEAVEFRRASPTIAKLAGALALDDATIDELFRSAMTIEV